MELFQFGLVELRLGGIRLLDGVGHIMTALDKIQVIREELEYHRFRLDIQSLRLLDGGPC